MECLTKLDNMQKEDLRKPQDYMQLISLEDARLELRYRAGMLDNRGCMSKKYTSKAYKELRHGMDPELVLKDRLIFLRRVQDLRK